MEIAVPLHYSVRRVIIASGYNVFDELFKGFSTTGGKLDLISNIIRRTLNIECAVLMGANVASEVAKENFCEATIGLFVVVFFINGLHYCIM
jgi:glycerol-3-phosphate dehydrogenase